jgi:hypothetical protein
MWKLLPLEVCRRVIWYMFREFLLDFSRPKHLSKYRVSYHRKQYSSKPLLRKITENSQNWDFQLCFLNLLKYCFSPKSFPAEQISSMQSGSDSAAQFVNAINTLMASPYSKNPQKPINKYNQIQNLQRQHNIYTLRESVLWTAPPWCRSMRYWSARFDRRNCSTLPHETAFVKENKAVYIVSTVLVILSKL